MIQKLLTRRAISGHDHAATGYGMNVKITGGQFYGALIVALSAWILQSFLLPLLVACVTAVASWPLYRLFVARLPRRMPPSSISLIFTSVMTVFVLAPLMFVLGALLAEAHALLLEIAAADKKGIPVPHWVENVPLVGPWLATCWQSELAHPGAPLGVGAADRPDCSR